MIFLTSPNQCGKQPFSENRVQIGASVRLEFCSQAESDTQTDSQTNTQTNCSENITPPRFRGGVKKSREQPNKVQVMRTYLC